MTSAMTPGHWKANQNHGSANYSMLMRDDGTNQWIACIQHNGEATLERQKADAEAMAAAPAMLEILNQVFMEAELNSGKLDWLTTVRVRELLAKLQPEAPTPPTSNQPTEEQDG
jgi:hypothetical protein